MSNLFFIAIFLLLAGCTKNVTPTEINRTEHAKKIAASADWQRQTLQTDTFTLTMFGPKTPISSNVLTIYIEGDGLAWTSKESVSENPTPINPLALKMAVHDHTNYPVVYLARPCQFTLNKDSKNCTAAYWTTLRFSPEVIASMNQAVSQLKNTYHAKKIQLIGYSGGGAIATLIAAPRTDIANLITVAGILDTTAWTTEQQLSPLTGSLNPAEEWQKLLTTPQTHWAGGKDKIVPSTVAMAYANHFPASQQPMIKIMPSFTHECCWATSWQGNSQKTPK